ncbi:T9SS type A sorting domain-containing protein [Flavobacterium olei]|uniref:T9SS type A sorting domain-containing protein n=1 Tax=Flavobacterium olei TaxID=1886782 RepID=UPI00321913A3
MLKTTKLTHMKIALLFFFITVQSFSQLYVGVGSSIYVRDQVLFVNQDLNLESTAGLYLRNKSQLLQGTSGVSTNKGLGILSVYQEGTSDNFEYNYWCSPVGASTAAAGNSNFGITMLGRPLSSTNSVPVTVLPIGSYDGTANPLAIAPYWIYKLIGADSYSKWVQVGANSTIAAGEGFTMKGTSGVDNTDPESTGIINNTGSGQQRYDFRGRPNDGNITVSVATGTAATLTGNPYPSALNLNAFLLDPSNSACTGVAYFWEQDKNVNSHYLSAYKGGYGTYSPVSLGSNGIYVAATFNSYNSDGTLNATGTSSNLSIERKYSPVGQGFLINGNKNATVTFKNSHRAYYKEDTGLSQFAKFSTGKLIQKKEDSQIPHFKINTIINEKFTRQLALALMEEATDGIDVGIDALTMDQSFPNDVSFLIEQKAYVIQGVPFEPSKKIALTVKSSASSSMKFYIPEVINFDLSESIYLYDALDDSYHDIKFKTYETTIPPGVYDKRFSITFSKAALTVEEQIKNNFFIIQDNKHQVLKVINPDAIPLKSMVVYDLLGRIILSDSALQVQTNYGFPTAAIASGMYVVVFMSTTGGKKVQKIVITNSGVQ